MAVPAARTGRARGKSIVGKTPRLPSLAYLAFRQSRAHARLIVGIALGILLAATVLAAIPLYLRAISDLGLSYAIDEHGASFLDFEAVSYSRPIARRDYEQAWAQAREAIRSRIGAFLREERRAVYTPSFVMAQRDSQGRESAPGERSSHAFFFFLTGLQGHVLMLEGRPPTYPPADGADVEALLSVWAAGDVRLRAGDVVTFYPFVTDQSQSIRVRIAGIIQPRDMNEDLWLGHKEYFFPTRDSGGQSRTFALYVPEEQFFAALGERFPVLPVNYWWIATVEPSNIKASDAARIRQSITDMEGDLNRALPRTLLFTGLKQVLNEYESKLVFARVPLLIFALLMLGTTLYYLMMTASFLLQRQAPDQAVLRARGASTGQLVGIFALQGAFVALPSALLGPLYAYLLVAPLGQLSLLAARTDGRWLSLPFAPETILWSAAGAAIAWVALLAPAVIAARRTVVDERQATARPEQRSFAHRAYIDLLLAAVALVLWLDLSQRGSFLAQRLFGRGPLIDGVLLVTPVLALAAGVLLALRLLPPLLGALASLAQRLPSPTMLLALRHLAREPLLAAGPLALLALVTAMMVFAASFGATLERSYHDRAAYQAGADIRVTATAGRAEDMEQALPQMPAVQASSLVLREKGRAGPGQSAADYTLLAVEPDSIQQVAWMRPDFSARPLSDQMWLVHAPFGRQTPKTLPGEPQRVGVWVHPDRAYSGLGLWLRLWDDGGDYFTYYLGQLDFEGWRFLEADLTPRGPPFPRYPLSLNALFMAGGRFSAIGPTGRVVFDDLHVQQASDRPSEAPDSFENPAGWRTLPIGDFIQDKVAATEEARLDKAAIAFSWTTPISSTPRGVFVEDVDLPIPVLASRSFLRASTYRSGEEGLVSIGGDLVPITVRGTLDYFPTLDPAGERFIVADREKLEAYLRAVPGAETLPPNEVWLALRPGADAREADRRLSANLPPGFEISSVSRFYRLLLNDPLAAAGWRAFLVIAYVAMAALALLGFALYALVYAQRHMTEYAILRASGFSRRQVAATVTFENGVLLALGLALGIGLGHLTSAMVVTYLDVTERGARVLPPFIPTVDWAQVGVVAGAAALLVAAATVAVVRALTSARLHRVLRAGE